MRCGGPPYLAVLAHGQASEVTQQTAQVSLKQAAVSQVLPSQVHKLVGIHHLALEVQQGRNTCK